MEEKYTNTCLLIFISNLLREKYTYFYMVISSIHPRYCRQPRHYLSSIHPPCCLQPRHYLSQPPHNQPPKQPDPLWIIKQKCFVLQRIKTEEKAMVVASVWGEEFIQSLASLAILPRTICKNRLNSTFSFKSSWCNSPYYSNRPIGKTESTTFALTSVFILLICLLVAVF